MSYSIMAVFTNEVKVRGYHELLPTETEAINVANLLAAVKSKSNPKGILAYEVFEEDGPDPDKCVYGVEVINEE